MNTEYRLDEEWLTRLTGDPFADTGGLVIKFLQNQEEHQGKSILELITYMTEIYVNKWDAKINAYFLNSKITQPAFDKKRKVEETLIFFRSILNGTFPSEKGYCRISGRQTDLYSCGRDTLILGGSSTFINFHHSFESGLKLSKEMLIRIFFVPFGTMNLGGKLALIQSNNQEINEYFIFENCKENLKALNSETAGVLRSPFTNPANCLFEFINDFLLKNQDAYKKAVNSDTSISLYHFTNFGAEPTIDIYNLPATHFRFYTLMQVKFKQEWNRFIKSFYKPTSKIKGATYEVGKGLWEIHEKDSIRQLQTEEFYNWWNPVLNNLLNGKPIRAQLLQWSRKHSLTFKIIKYYQTIIRNMEAKTVEKIKTIADYVVSDKQSKDSIKKVIRMLDKAGNGHDLRRVLRKLVEQNYTEGNAQPLLTVEEYSEYLFPDGSNWREIRDLLVIAIYQNLHQQEITLELELSDNDVELQNA